MTVPTLLVRDLLSEKVLVTRESARVLERPLTALMQESDQDRNESDVTSVTVDFDEVLGVAPSFVDELVSMFESILEAQGGGHKGCLIVANPPTRLSSKFEAVARGHAMSIRALPDGSWLLSDAEDAVPG